MTDTEKQNIINIIHDKIEEQKQSIKELEALTKPIAPDVAIGRLTRMEAINEKSINEASLRNAKNTLLRLEQVLTRVDDPEFGVCVMCKKPIPIARILRVPESMRCVSCVSK